MGLFHEGQKVWVEQPDGSRRAGVYVGEAETAVWFGGPPVSYVVFPEAKEGETVPMQMIFARDDDEK
jgi:hypothetical protein